MTYIDIGHKIDEFRALFRMLLIMFILDSVEELGTNVPSAIFSMQMTTNN